LREVKWDARQVAAGVLAVAILLLRGVDVAAVPPGTADDVVEAAVRAAGRPRELDGALIFKSPRPRRAAERVL
jgi:hypothetical protein